MTCRYRSIEDLRTAIDTDPRLIGEYTREVLFALQEDGRALDAVVHVAHAEAQSHAQALCRQHAPDSIKGRSLYGIPLAHKDLYMRKGWPCAAGSQVLEDHVADVTASSLAKLDTAGAVDCGRLDSVELALGTTGHNARFGTPRNPWNPDYICGGSSSGSAAVVAAGILPASLGSDTGGSVRLPAAACGLVGIKPTHGLVGRSGVIELSKSLDSLGPLTRSVRDAALMLSVLAGYDPDDPASIRFDCGDYLADLESGLRGVRIAWPDNHFFEHCDTELADGIAEVFKLAGQLGAERVSATVPGIESANAMTMLITAVEAFARHQRTVLQRHERLGDQTLARLLVGAFIPHSDYRRALSSREPVARKVLSETFSRADVLITPVWPYPLPTIEASDVGARPEAAAMVLRSGHNTRPVNYLGFPAITLPTGFDRNGLPTSLQLIAAPYQEAMLFRVARALERELDFWSARPDLAAVRASLARCHIPHGLAQDGPPRA